MLTLIVNKSGRFFVVNLLFSLEARMGPLNVSIAEETPSLNTENGVFMIMNVLNVMYFWTFL